MPFNLLLYTPKILQAMIWPVVRPMCRVFLKLDVKIDKAVLELPRGVIFLANHGSEMDVILVPASLPFLSKHLPTFYVARPREFYIHSGWRKYFYGGLIFKLWGAYPVRGGLHDYESSLKTHTELIMAGKSVLIFPEGRKMRDGKIHPEEARGGAAYLSERTGRPIVPVKIEGAYNLELKDFFLRRREVSLVFGKPIYPRELFSPKYCERGAENKYKSASGGVLRQMLQGPGAEPRPSSYISPVTPSFELKNARESLKK